MKFNEEHSRSTELQVAVLRGHAAQGADFIQRREKWVVGFQPFSYLVIRSIGRVGNGRLDDHSQGFLQQGSKALSLPLGLLLGHLQERVVNVHGSLHTSNLGGSLSLGQGLERSIA
jgi:hypothetical protein